MANNDDQISTPICTVDPCEYLQIKRNPDGTITRLLEVPSTPATQDPNSPSLVLTKDFPLNPIHKTFLRVFLPKIVFSNPSKKLPIIVYFHGGGFVILHADSCYHHDFCSVVASQVPAVVVSVDYRLAPEHRLPAAYEDAVEGLRWIKCAGDKVADDDDVDSNICGSPDEWLTKYGNLNNCFLMGTSAGGNIAYQAVLRASKMINTDLKPLKIKGMILHHPFFGGLDRTGSEYRLINDPFLPLSGNDLFWELSLPEGVGRDHEFCDPLVGDGPTQMEKIKEMGLQVLVTDCDGDPLVDRVSKLVKVLEEKGVKVMSHFTQGDHHGVEIVDKQKCEEFLFILQSFVTSCSDA